MHYNRIHFDTLVARFLPNHLPGALLSQRQTPLAKRQAAVPFAQLETVLKAPAVPELMNEAESNRLVAPSRRFTHV